LSVEKNLLFRKSFLGRKLSVITLDKKVEGQRWEAVSTNYLKVEVLGPGGESNQLFDVTIGGITASGLSGYRL